MRRILGFERALKISILTYHLMQIKRKVGMKAILPQQGFERGHKDGLGSGLWLEGVPNFV